MTAVETAVRKHANAEAEGLHALNLIQALGDPSKYDYRGECLDLGRRGGNCACGHGIRYAFPVYHRDTRDSKILGSTCVEHFAALNPEVGARILARIVELDTAAKEALRAAKETRERAEVQAAEERYRALYWKGQERYNWYRDANQKAPRALWEAYGSAYYRVPMPHDVPAYKRPKSAVQWFDKQSANLRVILGIPEEVTT